MPHEAMVLLEELQRRGRDGLSPTIELKMPATNRAVRDLLQSLDVTFAGLNLGKDALGDVQIVLAELLNNIVEHAYAGRSDGKIEISLGLDKNGLVTTIRDGGREMPGNHAPRKKAADLNVARENLPEGGFGWFMIYELVEELCYSRIENMNVIRFRMRVS